MVQPIEHIHNASIRILDKAGFKVNRSEIADALKRSGIRMSGQIAYFTEEQIYRQLANVPKQFTLFARNPIYDMHIGSGESYFASGYGCTFIIDENGKKRAALYEDYLNFAKLVHQSDHFKINGGILVQPNDIPAGHSIPMMMYAAMSCSDKCILGISSVENDVRRVMEMTAIVFGESISNRPRVLTLVNTTSSLELGNIASDTMLQCVKYSQPIIISPGPMSGATGPVTVAGNLALGNAETLATIAISQILQPGLPILYGLMPTTLNMASASVCIGSPVSSLNMVYSTRLAKFYGLPNRCGGTLTDAKKVNSQSGCESMMAMMASVGEKTSFMLHSAGILDSFSSMSYEKFIADLDVIRAVKRFYSKLDVSPEYLAVDEICETGIGGDFLSSDHTFEHFKEAGWIGEININRNLTEHESADSIYDANIARKMQQMLDHYKRPEMDRDARTLLNQYMVDEIGVDRSKLIGV